MCEPEVGSGHRSSIGMAEEAASRHTQAERVAGPMRIGMEHCELRTAMGRMAASRGNVSRSTRQATTAEVCTESSGQRCVFFKSHTIRGDIRRGVARTPVDSASKGFEAIHKEADICIVSFYSPGTWRTSMPF